MTITIKASDANSDGKGIDFTAYLADYVASFVKDGYGEFSGDSYAGEEYSFSAAGDDAQGVVLQAGSTDWAYDMTTHTVTGSLDAVLFGTDVVLDDENDRFTLDLDLAISGLGVEDSDEASALLSALDDPSIDALMALIKAEAVVFTGSTGKDTFSGFGHDDRISGGDGKDVLGGGGGADRLNGGDGNDQLTGGTGDDRLTGGAGGDTFLFAGKFGADIITDFEEGAGKDVLSLDHKTIDTYQELLAAATDTTKGLLIDLGANEILLSGVKEADLARNDFDFA